MKKILCLVLVVLMLSTLLVSCKKEEEDGGNNGDITTPVSTDPNRVAPEIKDFGGYEFKFLVNNDGKEETYEIPAPAEMNGVGINDIVHSRNKMVEGLYNIKISNRVNIHTGDEMFNALSNAAISGEYIADAIGTSARSMLYSLVKEGFFFNVYDLESLRLSSAWWDQDLLDETTINGYAYVLTGDIQPNDDLHQMSIAVNWSLYKKTYPSKNLYDIVVKDGTWTMEEFYNTWHEFGSRDQNSDGMIDSGDLIGLTYDSRTANYMYVASGLKAFSMESGQPVLQISSDKALKVVDWLSKTAEGKSGLKSAFVEDAGGYEVAAQHFAAGAVLLAVNQFHGSLTSQLDMADDVVYPPFPKYDAEQDRYYSLVQKDFEPLAISVNVVDKERTALILEALAFYSDKLQSEVMNILIQERLTSEAEPREMLQLTLNSKVYDMEYLSEVIGWTAVTNRLLRNNQLSNYSTEMKSLAKSAITAKGNGTLQTFLSKYAPQK